MSSFPTPITALKLFVSTGSAPNVQTFEESIPPSAISGITGSHRINNPSLINAFNSQSQGTIFNASIATTYAPGTFPSGNIISAPSVSNFVPNPIQAILSLATLPELNPLSPPFSLNDYITKNSPAPLSFSSNNTSVITVSSAGLVTIQGAGHATITITQAASSDNVYTATSLTRPIDVYVPAFSVITNSDFASLDFNSGMTPLFTNVDEGIYPITMPNSNFRFSSVAYTTLYAGSNGWFSFGTNVAEFNYGNDAQQPINTFRYFGKDHLSTGSYKFVSNNTRLLFKLTGYLYGSPNKTFTINVIIEQSGEIRINYTLASTFINDSIIIGYVGNNISSTSDDIFLTLGGVTFNRSSSSNLFSLLNGKSILYVPPSFPTFGTFTLPADIQVYKNQTITRELTPPTSNSPGAITFISSNTAVATISTNNNGVSSINVIGSGATTITAKQAASGNFASSFVTASLTVTVLYPTFGTFTLPADIQLYKNQTITRVLTPPTSNSSGAFTFTSSNTAVATITVNGGVSSINVIGSGATTITATQAASGDFSSSFVTASLTVTALYPTFGPFTLPADIQVYKNQTITRVLTPPTSNSSGAFTFTSSNTAVATITVNGGVSSINVIGSGATTITATQAASGDFSSSFVTASLTVTALYPTFGPFTLPYDELVYQNQTVTRVLTPPTSNSVGAFTFTSSNTAVATITVNGGVSSINVIGSGFTTITAIQAASGDFASSSISVLLNTITGTSVIIDDLIWNQKGADIDGEAAYDTSGWSVSLSSDGTIVAIGAQINDGNGTDSGHVRVYKYDVTKTTAVTNQSSPDFGPVGWRRLGQDIDGEAASDYSGVSVSLSADGTIVAIGAFYNDGNGSESGHVRVYKYDVTKTNAVTDQTSPDFGPVGWRRLGRDIDGEAAIDVSGFGVSLSADGTIVAIGARYNDGNGSSSGHVRVYKYDVTKTTVVTDQTSPDYGPVGWRRLGQDIDGEATNDYSGWSVSLSSDGTIVAIGAYQNDGNGSESGHVRVYKYDVTKTNAVTDQTSPNFGPVGWRRLGQDIDGEAASDASGYSVSLSADGTIVAIGAVYNNGVNGTYSGHVRVYKYDVTKTTAVTNQSSPDYGPVGWRRLGKDIDGEAAGDRSGYSVSLSADGTIVAIGAPYNNGKGHVRLYLWNGTIWRQLGQDIDGEATNDYSGWSVSLSANGTIVAIGAPYNGGFYGSYSGHVRVYEIRVPPLSSSLVARYPFDSNGNDISTNNNNLTNNNTVTFNTVGYKQGSGAASFNGSNYFEIANDGKFSPDNFTVAFWIKPVSSAGIGYQTIASCRDNMPNVSGWIIYITPDNSLQLWTGPGGFSPWSGQDIPLITGFGNLATWVHLAFTFTKATGSLVIYQNGTSITTVSRSYVNNTNNNLRIGAGANEGVAQFNIGNGTLLDDFRFYNKVLSASEVSTVVADLL